MIFLTTSALKVSFTNEQTGKTVTETASGPGQITEFPDGSAVFVAKRNSAISLLPADALGGDLGERGARRGGHVLQQRQGEQAGDGEHGGADAERQRVSAGEGERGEHAVTDLAGGVPERA